MNNKANKKEEQQISFKDANEALNEIYLSGSSSKFPDKTEADFLAILEKMEDSDMEEQTSEYFDFSKEGKYGFVFEGIVTQKFKDFATGEDKEIEVAKLREPGTGRMFIHGGAILISTCKKLQSIPCYIRVIATGKKLDGKKGKYDDIRVLTA